MSEPVSPLTAPQLLDVEQAASWCRITTNTLNHLRLQGRFAPAVKIGRRCYWRPQDILDWIEDQLEAGR